MEDASSAGLEVSAQEKMRLPGRYRPYRYPGGLIYLDITESPMMQARARGQYEPHKTRAIQSMLGPGMTFADVGANKGYFALIAARIVGEAGSVLAFEPAPENCHWIRQSVALNHYENTRLFELALSDANGPAELRLGEKSGWHSLLPQQTGRCVGTVPVQRRTLDSVLQEMCCQRLDMLKIDVEGAELQVLRGAWQTLSANPQLILVMDLHPYLGVNPIEVCSYLRGLGFGIYDVQAPGRRLADITERLTSLLAMR